MNATATNIPAWCKPLTEVYRKTNGGRWHLYDIISASADGVKVRMFEDYSDRIVTKTLADIISDGEKIERGEYETETRNLTPKQTEAIWHAFDVVPVGTVISMELTYLRITGYDQEHHRYETTSITGTGIRAEFVGVYFNIGTPNNEQTADELPTWCKVGAKVSRLGQGDYTISEISDGIVWLSRYDRDREGMSIDAFIWRVNREYITLLEAAPEITEQREQNDACISSAESRRDKANGQISDPDEDPTLTEAEKHDTLCRLWDAAWQQAQSDPKTYRVIVETNEEDPTAPKNEFGRYYMIDKADGCGNVYDRWQVIRVDIVKSPYPVHRPNYAAANGYADDQAQICIEVENKNNIVRWARRMIDAGRVTDIYADCY